MNAVQNVAVLHCSETIKGGIATYLRELIPLQCGQVGAERIVVVIPASQQDQLTLPAGVRIVPYADSGSRARRALSLAWTVAYEVRQSRPQAVHVHSTFAGATVRTILARERDMRIVYCPHGWAFDRPMRSITKAIVVMIERLLLRVSDAVICISGHERRIAVAHGLDRRKLKVVFNGVAGQNPVPRGAAPTWPEHAKRLLFVGRLDRQKGVDILCDAMRRLGTHAHAVVVGGAVLADSNPLQFPSNMTYLGWRDAHELETLFRSADILVIPSRWEGFGLIATEAMRAGLAVVASRVGGLPEVVEDGVTGLLVPPESSEAIVNAVRKLDRVQMKRMGDAGRRRFEALFTIDRVHRELWPMYGFEPIKQRVMDEPDPLESISADTQEASMTAPDRQLAAES